MSPEEFQATLPLILDWIHHTIAAHGPQSRTVASLNFPRLPQYFSRELLESARVIPVEVIPMPPLTAIGLPEFSEFENMDANGVTYLNTFFVKDHMADDERLHLHELVHVIQWRLLGPERFIAAYADGLTRYSYRDSPLERMAYMADAIYKSVLHPFNVEHFVRSKLVEWSVEN